MEICLKESIFNYDDGLPLLTPKPDTVALHEHCDVEQQTVRLDEDYDRQVWELMVALWGNLTDSTSMFFNEIFLPYDGAHKKGIRDEKKWIFVSLGVHLLRN